MRLRGRVLARQWNLRTPRKRERLLLMHARTIGRSYRQGHRGLSCLNHVERHVPVRWGGKGAK